MEEIKDKLERQIMGAKRGIEKTWHDLDRSKREAAKDLTGVEHAAYSLLGNKKHPRILMISVGGREYTSVRRLGGDRLETEFDTPEEVEATKMTVLVPVSLLPDEGMIGVIGIPQTFNAIPKNTGDVKFINEKTDYNDNDGWSYYCKLQFFLLGGGKYQKENWDFSKSPVSVRSVKRIGTKFFIKKNSEMVEEIHPNQDGNLEVPFWGYYWEKEEVKIQKDLNNTTGIFYVLVEGSSERETKDKKVSASQQLSPLTVRA